MPSSGYFMGPLIIGQASETALDYCTLADVETYAGVDFSEGIGPSDSQIATMISNASRVLDAYLGTQQASTVTVEEWIDSTTFGEHAVMGLRPVASVTKIEEVDGAGVVVKTLLQGRDRDSDEYWLHNPEAGIIRFQSYFGGKIKNFLKVTYVSGNTTVPAMVKMACILMVCRNAARAALNDENCMDRIKDMWARLEDNTQSELDWFLKQLRKEKLVGVATFGMKGAY
jgi:hypothetical protein